MHWWRKTNRERDLTREMRDHLDLEVAEQRARGLSADDALHAAQRVFGNAALVKEDVREAWGWTWLDQFGSDVQFGLRSMGRNPGFTIVAVLSLALGIGANTAIFTLIDAVLLKMLPVKNPQELVLFEWSSLHGHPMGAHRMDGNSWEENGLDFGTSFSYPSFQQLRARTQNLTDLFAFTDLGDHLNFVADGEAALARGQAVTGNYFTVLDVRAATGRLFEETDDRANSTPVCVISDGYWKRRFGGSANAIGKNVIIAGAPFTIVGVTPPEFFGVQQGRSVEVWLPLATQLFAPPDPTRRYSPVDGGYWWLKVIGRRKPEASTAQAALELDALFKQTVTLDDASPSRESRPVMPSLVLTPCGQGLDQLRRQLSKTLYILMCLVGLVLLVACANVANLLLARSTARQKEIGVRLSLGASRGRLIRQLLTESVLLAFLGGTLGMVLAYGGSGLLVTLITRADSLNLGPDLRILGFTAAACLLTGLLFGLAPALRATRVDLTPALKRGSRGGAGGSRMGLAKALVVAQAALSIVLLFGAGLFVRTLLNLEHLNTGFEKENLLLFGVNPGKAGYQPAVLKDLYGQIQQRLAGLPGVTSATASLHLLLSGSSRSDRVWVPGYSAKPGDRMDVRIMPAGPNFFQTMKIPLLRGRDFQENDNEAAPKVILVNETLVKRFFAGRDPIGEHIGWNAPNANMEIVGVVKDAKYDSLRRDAPATVYQPYQQADNLSWMHFEVRTVRNPKALIPDVRAAVADLDRNVALFDVKTQTEQVDELLLQERLFAKLSSFFGLLALTLACVGLYGIMSYSVVRRTGEIGIRMALGAQRWNILAMVQCETFLLVGIGVAIGIPTSLLTTRFAADVISNLLYGLAATDLTTIGIAAVLMMAVAAIAGFLPARRASRVDPTVALRYE
jgi:predicted permease